MCCVANRKSFRPHKTPQPSAKLNKLVFAGASSKESGARNEDFVARNQKPVVRRQHTTVRRQQLPEEVSMLT